MSKVIVNNLATEYKDEGEGAIILMLHGWMRNLNDFDKITEILKPKFRIIRLDLPGFGNTEMPKEIWQVSDYVNFVKSFLEKMGVKPDFVLGHSFGGRIILKNQFGAKKLILVSSAGLKTRGWRKNIFMLITKIGDLITLLPPLLFIRKKIKNKFYKIISSDYADAGPMQNTFKAVVEEDLSDYARKIKSETLLIWGENDIATPLSQAKKLNKLISNSQLKIIAGSSHFVHIEKSEEVVKLIEEFI